VFFSPGLTDKRRPDDQVGFIRL